VKSLKEGGSYGFDPSSRKLSIRSLVVSTSQTLRQILLKGIVIARRHSDHTLCCGNLSNKKTLGTFVLILINLGFEAQNPMVSSALE
jgi:hypothetical protein